MHDQEELERLLALSIKIKKINEEIRIEIEQRVAELTVMLNSENRIN